MNLIQYLGVKTQSVTASRVVLSVQVSDQLMQPFGIVHGGINTVLAETAASLGANQWLHEHQPEQVAVGVSVNTQHLRPVSDGQIKVVATPIKCGHQLQVWQATTYNQQHQSSFSTVTLSNQPGPQ